MCTFRVLQTTAEFSIFNYVKNIFLVHALRAYRGSRDIAPLIPNFGTR
jgi:hypothetical protein